MYTVWREYPDYAIDREKHYAFPVEITIDRKPPNRRSTPNYKFIKQKHRQKVVEVVEEIHRDCNRDASRRMVFNYPVIPACLDYNRIWMFTSRMPE